MKRVKKGEKYWFIYDRFEVSFSIEDNSPISNKHFETNNYFHTKEEAEAMAKKIRKVLNGAEVIKMPSEEDVYNKEFKTNPYFFGKDGADVVCAHQEGFNHCFEWFKSKIVK